MQEQVIAIFDKPETCGVCPFAIPLDTGVAFCKMTNHIVSAIDKFGENKDCQLIDYDEYHESLDMDNYK